MKTNSNLNPNPNKSDCFEYLLDILSVNLNGDISQFTILKAMKLLFLCVGVTSDTKNSLLKIFNNFVAMPYGPVESDVYNMASSDSLSKYRLSSTCCIIKQEDYHYEIEDKYKELLSCSVELLLAQNQSILKCSTFELVDITHKWSCWRICYNVAIETGRKSLAIPVDIIMDSVKFYK